MESELQKPALAFASHVVFLERGQAHVSGLISSSNTKCRIIDEKGKPRKLKLDRVVAASDSHKKAAAIAKKATSLASGIDLGIAWEAAKGESLSFESLAMRLFPKESVVEASAAAQARALKAEGLFFGKGRHPKAGRQNNPPTR